MVVPPMMVLTSTTERIMVKASMDRTTEETMDKSWMVPMMDLTWKV